MFKRGARLRKLLILTKRFACVMKKNRAFTHFSKDQEFFFSLFFLGFSSPTSLLAIQTGGKVYIVGEREGRVLANSFVGIIDGVNLVVVIVIIIITLVLFFLFPLSCSSERARARKNFCGRTESGIRPATRQDRRVGEQKRQKEKRGDREKKRCSVDQKITCIRWVTKTKQGGKKKKKNQAKKSSQAKPSLPDVRYNYYYLLLTLPYLLPPPGYLLLLLLLLLLFTTYLLLL